MSNFGKKQKHFQTNSKNKRSFCPKKKAKQISALELYFEEPSFKNTCFWILHLIIVVKEKFIIVNNFNYNFEYSNSKFIKQMEFYLNFAEYRV